MRKERVKNALARIGVKNALRVFLPSFPAVGAEAPGQRSLSDVRHVPNRPGNRTRGLSVLFFAEVMAQLGIEPMTKRYLVVALTTKLLGQSPGAQRAPAGAPDFALGEAIAVGGKNAREIWVRNPPRVRSKEPETRQKPADRA